ncbi:MAG: FAD:protein FMN transferase [Gammaproteobacteria bacterium]|nr:FAD:protein FMN transferase [Gammaproteobacteria bacterium]
MRRARATESDRMRSQVGVLLMVGLALFALAAAPAAAEWHREEAPLMGTSVSVELWHEDAETGRAAARAVMAEYHRINARMSNYREDSEISHVNRVAYAAPVTVSEELFGLLARALEISRLSDGAFDITFDSVGQHYDFRSGQRPDAATLASELEVLDYRLVELDEATRSVRFLAEGVRLNLGGIGKGYAVERGAEILRERGIAHALLNAGGDSRVIGDRRGQPWWTGIRDPRDADQVVVRLPLQDEAVSTSGDYERYFEAEGVRYHHILDPASGLPVGSLRSATVIGPDAVLTDALSTTVFVLGVEQGMALIARLPAYEAVLIDHEGRMAVSSGLAPPP